MSRLYRVMMTKQEGGAWHVQTFYERGGKKEFMSTTLEGACIEVMESKEGKEEASASGE